MSKSLKEAKDNALINMTTNVIVVALTAIISILLTPYLIKRLGLAVYGIIPLVNSVVQYFNFFTIPLSGAVSRFVTLHYTKGDFAESNRYFNSAFFPLLVFCFLSLIPVFIILFFFSSIFNIPLGQEKNSSLLLIYCFLSSAFFVIAGPYGVSAFIRHRFDLSNYLAIASKLLRVVILIFLFEFLQPRLEYFGLSYISMSLFYLISFIFLCRYLTPELRLNISDCRWVYFKELGAMSFWLTVNLLSVFLYLGVGFILINIFLGPEDGGRYGSLAQWVVLLQALGQSISNLFAPIAIVYVAKNDLNTLSTQLRISTRLMSFIMALPISILCGFAKPLLTWWLGESFTPLWPLMWFLLMPWLITISYKPAFAVFRAVNKMKLSAIVSLIIGIFNIALAISLLKFSNWGIYGVAFALGLSLILKDMFFTPIYAAYLTKKPPLVYVKSIFAGVFLMVVTAICSLLIGLKFIQPTLVSICFGSIVITIIYAPLCFWGVMKKHERQLVLSLVFKK